MLDALAGHADLGFHTGMITDGVLRPGGEGRGHRRAQGDRPGAGRRRRRAGQHALYDRLREFPVEFRPASYTHAPAVLSQLQSLVSVNSPIEVDLLGQVGAELRRGVHIGAVGGQVDFSRAASLTGDRSVIALRSGYRGGESTINPDRSRGGVVTTARGPTSTPWSPSTASRCWPAAPSPSGPAGSSRWRRPSTARSWNQASRARTYPHEPTGGIAMSNRVAFVTGRSRASGGESPPPWPPAASGSRSPT